MEGGFKKAMDRGVNAAPTWKNERSEFPHVSTNLTLKRYECRGSSIFSIRAAVNGVDVLNVAAHWWCP